MPPKLRYGGHKNKLNIFSINIRIERLFIDDPRIVERFELLSKFLIPGYVITNFMYDTKHLKISYSKKLDI